MATTRVIFKNEGEDAEGPFGPVKIIDVARYDAWMATNTKPGSIGIPYGSKPDGVDDRGWLPRASAVAIASEFGVLLEES